jgi:hypothetical protein
LSAKKKSGVPANKLELFDKLMAVNPKIERKGANHAYAAVNGNMYLLMQPSGKLALRLPADAREKFLEKYKTRLFEAYGAVMNRIRRGSRCATGKNQGTAKICETELRVWPRVKTQAPQEKGLAAAFVVPIERCFTGSKSGVGFLRFSPAAFCPPPGLPVLAHRETCQPLPTCREPTPPTGSRLPAR